jgi:hypothetical protein
MDTTAELEERIRAVEDELALRRLVDGYQKTGDSFDWQGWSHCFSENAVFVNQFGSHHGRQEIHDLCKRRFGKTFQVFQHVITNLLLDITRDSAIGTANLIFVGMKDKNRKGDYFLGGGRYEWTFARGMEGWKIERGVLTFLWDNVSAASPEESD